MIMLPLQRVILQYVLVQLVDKRGYFVGQLVRLRNFLYIVTRLLIAPVFARNIEHWLQMYPR